MAAYNEVNHFDRSASAFAPLRLLSNSTKKPLFFALDELQPVICSSKTGRDALRELYVRAFLSVSHELLSRKVAKSQRKNTNEARL